jgi:hypothetical protein
MKQSGKAIIVKYDMYNDGSTSKPDVSTAITVPDGLAIPVPNGYIVWQGGLFTLHYFTGVDSVVLPNGNKEYYAGFRMRSYQDFQMVTKVLPLYVVDHLMGNHLKVLIATHT